MVGKTQGAYAATYAYRFGDKLKAVTSNFPGETASVGYNYDGLGHRRLEQRDNTTATWFRWSGWEECGEYAGTVGSWTIGALQTGYVPGLATFAGANPATAEWRYHLTDHLGSVRQLSGQTKAALARYDYAPYGELMRNAGLPLTVGYTGHLWDSAIGQYYAPFRYYNPQTARWNMRDPLGFVDGPNVYAYVAGNPITAVDYYGLISAPCSSDLAVIGLAALVAGVVMVALGTISIPTGIVLGVSQTRWLVYGAILSGESSFLALSNFRGDVEHVERFYHDQTGQPRETWRQLLDEEQRGTASKKLRPKPKPEHKPEPANPVPPKKPRDCWFS